MDEGNNVLEMFYSLDGYAVVIENDHCGLVNTKGEVIVPCVWRGFHEADEDENYFCEGLAAVQDDRGKWGFVNEQGDLVIDCRWDEVRWFENMKSVRYPDYLCAVMRNDLWGWIDKSGRLYIPCQWTDVMFFNDGLCSVCNKSGLWGALNQKGRIQIPCQYTASFTFSNGTAFVKKKGNHYEINTNGDVIQKIKTGPDWKDWLKIALKTSIVLCCITILKECIHDARNYKPAYENHVPANEIYQPNNSSMKTRRLKVRDKELFSNDEWHSVDACLYTGSKNVVELQTTVSYELFNRVCDDVDTGFERYWHRFSEVRLNNDSDSIFYPYEKFLFERKNDMRGNAWYYAERSITDSDGNQKIIFAKYYEVDLECKHIVSHYNGVEIKDVISNR